MSSLFEGSTLTSKVFDPRIESLNELNRMETFHEDSSYLNNANKIAPYFISVVKDDVDEACWSKNPSNKKDEMDSFYNQVSQVLYEILPTSYWKIPHDNDSNDTTKMVSMATTQYSTIRQSEKNSNISIVPSFVKNQIQINTLSGGLSNHLYTVTNIETKQTVLIRIHPTTNIEDDDNNIKEEHSKMAGSGHLSSTLINREGENRIVSFLSKHRIGPKFYGRFKNGRVEEYYTNHKTLTYKEMVLPRYASSIAIQMSNLHSLPFGKMMESTMVTNDRNGEEIDTNSNDIRKHGDVWQRIDTWLELAKESLSQCSSRINKDKGMDITSNDLAVLYSLLHTIENEWKWYKKQMLSDENDPFLTPLEIIASNFCREVVFTHMDCQSLNILTPIVATSEIAPPPPPIDEITNELSSSPLSEVSVSPPSYSSSGISILNASFSKTKGNDFFVTSSSGLVEPVDDSTQTTMNSSQASNITNYNDALVKDDTVQEQIASVRLIDFEYSGFNRRVVDIANTFLEHCDMNNLKPKYDLEYPSDEEQNIFIEEYINQCWVNNYMKLRHGRMMENNDFSCETNQKMLNKRDVKSSLLVDRLVTFMPDMTTISNHKNGKRKRKSEWKMILKFIRLEILKHTLISHLEWSTWSIIQINNSIDFDYVKYAKLRIDGYFHFKTQCFRVRDKHKPESINHKTL